MKMRKLTYGLVSLVIIIVFVAMLVASCAIPEPSRPITEFSSSVSATTTSSTSVSNTPTTSATTTPLTTMVPTPTKPVETVDPNRWGTNLEELMRKLHRLPVAGDSIPYNARILRTAPMSYGVGLTTDPVIIYNTEDLCSFLLNAATGWQWKESDLAQMRLVYNDNFFHDKVLIAGVIGLTSGSIQLGVSEVTQTQTKLYVDFSLTYPQFGTSDMMSWHYFIEVSTLDAAGRTPSSNLPSSTGNPIAGNGRMWADM